MSDAFTSYRSQYHHKIKAQVTGRSLYTRSQVVYCRRLSIWWSLRWMPFYVEGGCRTLGDHVSDVYWRRWSWRTPSMLVVPCVVVILMHLKRFTCEQLEDSTIAYNVDEWHIYGTFVGYIWLIGDVHMTKRTTSATWRRLCDEVQDLTQFDLEWVEVICRHLHTSSTETEIIVGAN